MTTSKFRSPEFLKLRRRWYDKLRRSGFHDIEHVDWNTGRSREMLDGMNAADMARRWNPEKADYFRKAGWVLSLLEQPTWEREGEGGAVPWGGRHPLLMGLPGVSRAMAVRCWAQHAAGYGHVLASRRAKVRRRVFERVVNHLRGLLLSGELEGPGVHEPRLVVSPHA